MIKFYFKRNFKDLFGHFILIGLPILLIMLLHFINSTNFSDDMPVEAYQAYTVLLGFGFILMFQIYGSALSFEGLAKDLYTQMITRLKAAPIDLRGVVFSNMLTSSIVNFIQSFAIFVASYFVLGMRLNQVFLVILVVFVSVIFNQMLGVLLLFMTKKANTTQTIITIYGIIAPILMGLYYPLPDNPILNFFKDYGTPTSLAYTAVLAANNHDYAKFFLTLGLLVLLCVAMFFTFKPFLRRASNDL